METVVGFPHDMEQDLIVIEKDIAYDV